MPSIDYQWPSNVLPLPARVSGRRNAARMKEELEDQFTRMLGFESLVLPSGRAALSLAIKLANVARRHVVFAPRFSSHCVWNIVGRYGNPAINFADAPDAMIAVHKFGIPHGFARCPATGTIIEDSCDSIVLGPAACFPNGGDVELFSLPKIMGSYGGGVLACRTAEIAESARRLTAEAPDIGEAQGLLRWQIASGAVSGYNIWDANEFDNFHPDETLLRQLLDHFEQIDVNRRTIESRLRIIRRVAGHLISPHLARAATSRLPPVLSSARLAASTSLMVRHINEAAALDEPRFVKHGLIPLHFGVDDEFFDECLGNLQAQ